VTFVPTLKFQQAKKDLQHKKFAGDIDEVEYHRLLDDLITKEVQDHQSAVIDLAIQEMRDTESRNLQEYEIKQKEEEEQAQIKLKEEERYRLRRMQLEREKERKRQIEQDRQKESEAEQKRESRQTYRRVIVPDEIENLKKQYSRAKRFYTWLQIGSIVFSITATSLVGTDIVPRWVAVICSGFAAMAATALSTFQMRERNYSYYQAISGMESEIHDYDQQVGEYANTDDDQAYQHFSARVSEIKQRYISQELSMWKATEPSTNKDEVQLTPSRQQEDGSKEDAEEEQERAERLRNGDSGPSSGDGVGR